MCGRQFPTRPSYHTAGKGASQAPCELTALSQRIWRFSLESPARSLPTGFPFQTFLIPLRL